MKVVETLLTCDGCKADVPLCYAQLHLDEKTGAMAWDHRTHSERQCGRYSALRNRESVPVEASARLADRLNKTGAKHRIRILDLDSTIAYHVKDVHVLLWLSANVIAPAGYEPNLVIPKSNPRLSTVLSNVPLGVSHHCVTQPEYLYLRLGVGDWLLTSQAETERMRVFSAAQMRTLLKAAGAGPELQELQRDLEVS